MNSVRLNKYHLNKSAFIERTLSFPGNITTTIGSVVKGFDKLGECSGSEKTVEHSFEGKFTKQVGEKAFANDTLWLKKTGPFKTKEGKAPFSGIIKGIDFEHKKYTIQRPISSLDLISGVAGEVAGIAEGRSVLIKTPALEISAVAGKGEETQGELILYGSSDEELTDIPDKFLTGKIVVVGILNSLFYSKAKFFGARAFVAGGISYSLYKALPSKPAILILGGFGKVPADPLVFDYLRSVNSRFVVVRPGIRQFLVPEPTELPWAQSNGGTFVELKIGNVVQLFSYPYFGVTATVAGFEKDKVVVEIWGSGGREMVSPENLGVIADKISNLPEGL